MNVYDRTDPQGLSVTITDLLVATADASDALLDGSVQEVLRLLRDRMQMDVLFVSEFVDGRRVFRFVDGAKDPAPIAVGDDGPLEQSYCKLVTDGRLPESVPDLSALAARRPELPALPFPIGEHLSTPVVLKDGSVYGTLCCFSASPSPQSRQRDLTQLRQCAQLVARKVEVGGSRPAPGVVPDWTIAPVEDKGPWKL
jgi:hypothetical protein